MEAAALITAMKIGGTVLGVAGSIGESRALRAAAKHKRQAAEFQAVQLEQKAKETIGAGQRTAAEQRRQGEIVQSRIVALAGASGGGVSDPTIVSLMSDTAGEAEYRARLAMYEGESFARDLRLEAAGLRTGAEAESRFLKTRARTTLIKGIAGGASDFATDFGPSLYEKYAMGSATFGTVPFSGERLGRV